MSGSDHEPTAPKHEVLVAAQPLVADGLRVLLDEGRADAGVVEDPEVWSASSTGGAATCACCTLRWRGPPRISARSCARRWMGAGRRRCSCSTTEKSHVGHLLAKLAAHDRTQLAISAYEAGMVPTADGLRPQ